MGKLKKFTKTFWSKFTNDTNFRKIDKLIVFITFIISMVTGVAIPLYKNFSDKPEYSFVLNNPVGWSKNDDIFSVYNYSNIDLKDTTVYIRSFMILSSGSNGDNFNAYMSSDSKFIPMEGLDMRFQLTGKSKGMIGHITMDKEYNPFSNYFVNSFDDEFGPNLQNDISWKISEKHLENDIKDFDAPYDKMNIVIFTIFDKNIDSYNIDYKKIQVYATDYRIGESRTKLVNTNEYFEKFNNSQFYANYYTRKSYDEFWNDQDITSTYYNKFIDEIIYDSLPSDKQKDYYKTQKVDQDYISQ